MIDGYSRIQKDVNLRLTDDELRAKIQTTVNKLEQSKAVQEYECHEQENDTKRGNYVDVYV